MNQDANEGFVPEEQPVEIEDEYRLAQEIGVEDESSLEPTASVNFTITSYGADYTVDTLLKRLETDAFYVPQFQRRFVWSQRHASRFIESLLMGLPVPGIFLYRDTATNQHLVVDGQQRLTSLRYFYSGHFGERKFRLLGVREEWSNKTYSDLSPSDQRKIDDSVVHATIFQQDEPKDSLRSLYFVFERINSGGIRLSRQEIRNCINDGPFLDLIRSLNNHASWREIFGQKEAVRLKDQELILRFLAMLESRRGYARPMGDFLNGFTAAFASAEPPALEHFALHFKAAIDTCYRAFGKRAFRPSGALNAAVFEAVMVGVAERLMIGPIDEDRARAAYEQLVKNGAFMRACERATADEESVKIRHSLALEAFAAA